jgi:hypothetical protein
VLDLGFFDPLVTFAPSLVRMSHSWASLPMMGVLPNPIYAREALLPMSSGTNVM